MSSLPRPPGTGKSMAHAQFDTQEPLRRPARGHGPGQAARAVGLTATAAAMTCPSCGTSNAWCRVWAGGPGHTLGMHAARLTLAQHALTLQLAGMVEELAAPAAVVQTTMLASAISKGHKDRTVRHHPQVRAA